MRSLTRLAIALAVLLSIQSLARPGSFAQEAKANGTIIGRVTVDGKPAQGVTVMAVRLLSNNADGWLNLSASIKASTDSDGRYRLEGVPTGKYKVAPFAPEVVGSDDDTSKEATVAEGATAEPVDFSLLRSGVITGKVTDSEGRPVLLAHIRLEASGKEVHYSASNFRMYFTDDRGIYRIFGLRPGHYLVQAGTQYDDYFHPIPRRIGKVWTYYPGVTDEAKAKPVEVTAGSEASGVDIKFDAPDKVFTASGRVIDAETGAPIADAYVQLSAKGPSFPDSNSTPNARGEFRFESLGPGAYEVESQSARGDRTFYTDPVSFEVGSANVDKLDLKAHTGASISGIVVVENTDGAAALDSLAFIDLQASVTDAQMKPYSSRYAGVASDGSFRMGGFKAGKAKIGADSDGAQKFAVGDQHFAVRRVERNGVEQPDGIDIQPNEQITGVRVIIVRADCVIRGHVTIQGEPLPIEKTMRRPMTLWAVARSPNVPGSYRDPNCVVDAQGNFVIENLVPGYYEVEATLGLFIPPADYGKSLLAKYITSTKQAVTVSSKSPAEVELVLVVRKLPDK
jgi:protocatechuate 3,4-dioxygenase beta subunit